MRLLIIIFIVLMSCSCRHREKNEAGKLSFLTSVDKWEKQGDLDFLLIKTGLINETADTITYISMICSGEDAYTTDSKDISIFVSPCDKNGPLLVKVPPDKSVARVLRLTSKKSIDQLRNIKFRVGFNLVTARDRNDVFSKVSELKQMKNVIWSDSLEIE